jgi:hypothetical protein
MVTEGQLTADQHNGAQYKTNPIQLATAFYETNPAKA